jgi:molybdopterin converting factor small subunit
MKVRVRFLGPFYHLTGRSGIDLDVKEGITLGELFSVLDASLGRAFSENVTAQIETNEKLRHLIHINGRMVSNMDGMQTRLYNDDVVSFLPPMEGG